jgi:hypothetical protein
MSKTITIYQSRGTKALSRTERGILFDKLQTTTTLSPQHFDAFNEMADAALPNYRSQLPAIMIKNIMDNIQPVVGKKTNTRAYTVPVQFNFPISTANPDFLPGLTISRDTQLDIRGIKYNASQTYQSRNIKKPLILRTSLETKIQAGLAGVTYLPASHRTYFTQEFISALHNLKAQVMFRDEKHAVQALKLLNTYHRFRFNYYSGSLFIYHLINRPQFKVLNTRVPVIKQPGQQVPQSRNPLLDFLSKISNISSNRMVAMYDIEQAGLWNIYSHARVRGIDNPRVSSMVTKHLANLARINEDLVNTQAENRANTRRQQIAGVAKSLFDKTVTQLTKAEFKLVIQNITPTSTPCDALIARVIQSAKSGKRFARSEWKRLRKVIENSPDADRMLVCLGNPDAITDASGTPETAGTAALCPHNYNKFEMLSGTYNDQDLRRMLLKYTGKVAIDNAFFCKICGEKLIQQFHEGHQAFVAGKRVHTQANVNLLSSQVWKVSRNIINANVEFDTPTDVKALATAVTDVIHPFIDQHKKAAEDVRTNTPGNITDIVYLYTTIYVYAMLSRIISHNPDDMRFKIARKPKTRTVKSRPTGGNPQPKNPRKVNVKHLQTTLSQALTFILKNDSLIKSISYISRDAVKPMLIKAFKSIMSTQVSTKTFNYLLPSSFVMRSRVYKYLHHANRMHRELNFTDIRRVLGIELDDVAKTPDLLAKAVIPKSWGDSKYSAYTYASFIHFIDYVKNNLHMMSWNSVRRDKHYKQYLRLLEFERPYFKELWSWKRPIFVQYYHDDPAGMFVRQAARLSQIYCSDGQKHNFKSYVMSGNREFQQSWITNPADNKALQKMDLQDIKCTRCNALKSKPDTKTNINEVLNMLEHRRAFFNMYSFKCPKSGKHEYNTRGKCAKCNVTKLEIFQQDQDYYEKYRHLFNKYLSETSKINDTIRKENFKRISDTYKPSKPIISKKSTWKNSQDYVELARLVNVQLPLIENIGLYENRNLDDLSRVRQVATDPELRTQALSLANYTGVVAIEYEMLRNGNITSPTLQVFSEKWEINFAELPAIQNSYDEFRKHRTAHLPNDKLVNFGLSTLSTALITIHRSKKHPKAAKAFVKYMVDKIIRHETSACNPGILRGKYESIAPSEEFDATESDDLDDSALLEDTYDPFSTDAYDVDSDMMENNMITGDD